MISARSEPQPPPDRPSFPLDSAGSTARQFPLPAGLGMGRGRVRLAGLGLLTSAWLLGPPVGARAEAVVIAATAPGYATGQRLGDGPIAVPDGASLVFLVETGQVVTVKGPYDGPPPAPKADAAGRLGRLARLGGTDQSQIGGTRGLANPEDLARAVPLDLYVATDRGRYPAYRPGEPARARPSGQPRRLR